jgi:hypothetical protein
MWRPKDWNNPISKNTISAKLMGSIPPKILTLHDAYEAGADAMLEALSKIPEKGILFPDYTKGLYFIGETGNTYHVIFIPDEIEKG